MFRRTQFPNYRQLDQMDCGPVCIKIVAAHFGKDLDLDYLRDLSGLQKGGVSLEGVSDALETIGITALGITASLDELIEDIPLPAIAHWEGQHFVVVYKADKRNIFISDPAFGLVKYSHAEFLEKWQVPSKATGVLLLLERESRFGKVNKDSISNYSLNFLYSYLRPYKGLIGQLFLGLCLASIVQLIFPFLTQSLVDYGIDYSNIGFIHLVVIAQVFLFLTKASTEIVRSWILLHLSTRVNVAMISDFLDKIISLPISYFESKTTGDFMQRIYDHHRIDDFLSGRSLSIIFDFFTILIFAFVLGYFNFDILLFFVIGTVIFMGWSLLFMRRKAFLDHLHFNLERNEQSILIQMIRSVQEIKLNGSGKRRKLEWKTNQVKSFQLQTQILKTDLAQLKGGAFINELTNILIIFWSAKAVVSGQITMGAMLAIQFVIGSLSVPISNTLTFITGLQHANLSLRRLSEVHNHTNENLVGNDNFEINSGDIRIEQLSFSYRNLSARPLLFNFNALIPYGKTTAIVGSSGSGKTTLLKLLLKFYEPNNGDIRIGSESLKFINIGKWREQCGAVLQDGTLFNDTLERNITESRSNSPTNIKNLRNAVKMANLMQLVDSLPLGYQTIIGEEGNLLSGGERQRILIARAIYKNPDYLFFDEATSSLDAENEMIITENLRRVFRHKTVVIIAHRLSTIRHADQILVMDNGEIVEQGSHAQLVSQGGNYHKLITNQL
ncbi:peptidase domain-containing ABC transporter [Flavobacteriaceae bacterium F89]|uniref:Peptidase domain-containing ABC transporter n=1 Tax=Cerina litoralis TaxID=2874477 RepID=A0AAE3EVR1_9FLAO|nr:peptidase domain-containing ABC transporter [Cerina litoralis]MCG2460522.1 peptidase domain-containing ABC transporter [Cerina litoralis]